MSGHFHAVVWIDHAQARIFSFNATDVTHSVVHPEKHQHGHAHHGQATEDREYLKRVEAALADAGAILITGPGNEKTALMKHIESHAPTLKPKIAAVQPLDHPSDGQIVAHARAFFKFDHQAPPRIS